MNTVHPWPAFHTVVVRSQNCVQLFATPGTAACQASLSFTISWSLLRLRSIESVMPSNHLIFCHPLCLLPSIFPRIRVYSDESALCIRWPKYWSFSISISPSNAYSGLISFRLNRLDLLAVQGILQDSSPTPQFESINPSVLSLLYGPTYMTTGKTTALTVWIFLGKVMSLLFNMLFRLATAFRSRNKRLLIS